MDSKLATNDASYRCATLTILLTGLSRVPYSCLLHFLPTGGISCALFQKDYLSATLQKPLALRITFSKLRIDGRAERTVDLQESGEAQDKAASICLIARWDEPDA